MNDVIKLAWKRFLAHKTKHWINLTIRSIQSSFASVNISFKTTQIGSKNDDDTTDFISEMGQSEKSQRYYVIILRYWAFLPSKM